ITTAPVSPLGQQFYVPTRDATDVASPTTLAPDPTRIQNPANREQPIHPLYGNIYVTDRSEGLIVVGVATTINGNPRDNFLHPELTFNPDNVLKGAASSRLQASLPTSAAMPASWSFHLMIPNILRS